MTTGGGRGPSVAAAQHAGGLVGDAIVRGLVAFHLSYRVATRLHHLLSPGGGARSRPWKLALIGSTVADVVGTMALVRSDEVHLAGRTAVEAADAFLWACSPAQAANTACLPAMPFLVEAGLRTGPRRAMVPALSIWGAVAAGRRLTGRRAGVELPCWIIGAVLGGAQWRRHEREQEDAVRNAQRASVEASRARAHLAGQSSVATGADTALDLLVRTMPIIGDAAQGSALDEITRSWKGSLAEQVGETAVYLGTALLVWQRARNLHPDLSTHVQFDVAPGDGTALLTAAQAVALDQRLSVMALAGSVTVCRVGDGVPRPGERLVLLIAGSRVEVPADPGVAVRPFSPGPLTNQVVALTALGALASDHGGAPWGSVVAPTAALAVMGHRTARRPDGDPTGRTSLLQAAAFALVYTEVVGRWLPQGRDVGWTGDKVHPYMGSLLGIVAITQFHRRRLSPWHRLLAAATVAAVVARGWSLIPPPRGTAEARTASAEAVWHIAAFWTTRFVGNSLEAGARALADAWSQESRAVSYEAFEDGRRSVLDLLAVAHAEAVAQMEAAAPRLPADLAQEARRRLDEVARRIAEAS